jgi:hypothetical protein
LDKYLEEHIDVRGPDECWLWSGVGDRNGYRQARYQGKHWQAHRLVWTLERGPIPKGMLVCHSCDTPPCCNPSHLWLGTNADNTEDRERKGRTRAASGERHGLKLHPETAARGDRNGTHTHPEAYPHGDDHWTRAHPESVPRGEANGFAKLTDAQVLDIRRARAEGESVSALAAAYGVDVVCIYHIVRGETWRHLLPNTEEQPQ